MRRLLPALLALSLALAACGGDDEGGSASGGGGAGPAATTDAGATPRAGGLNEYPREVVDNFMRSCTNQDGATETACRCILDRIRARYTIEEFARAERALTRGQATNLNLEALARACTR